MLQHKVIPPSRSAGAVASVNKAIPLIALQQECVPVSAQFFQKKLGAEWEFFAEGSEDNVATFWDTKVALRLG